MTMIADLFGRSPVRPMQRHIAASVLCAKELPALIDAMRLGDFEAIAAARARIDELEHAADAIKHDIRLHLPRRLFMAIERRDMLEILDYQDSIADRAQDLAELCDLRKMVLPPSMCEPVQKLINSVVKTCEQAESVVNELDELVETGFRGKEVERVEKMITELGQLESATDRYSQASLMALFAIENELGLATFFWYQWLGWAEQIANFAEKVGNRLRLLIAT